MPSASLAPRSITITRREKPPHDLQVVFNDQESVAFRVQALDEGDDLLDLGRVEAGHDLVEEHDARLQRQCPGDLEAPALAQRQDAGPDAGAVLQAHEGKRAFGLAGRP